MHEILFKGFHPDENGTEKVFVNGEWIRGYWVYGSLISNPNEKYYAILPQKEWSSSINAIKVIPETVCQYTGLKDKNGNMIFEGDIVKNDWCFMKGNSVVKLGAYKSPDMGNGYMQGHLGFYLEHIDKSESKTSRKDIMFFANNCEIIGSVHSNPELLEVL